MSRLLEWNSLQEATDYLTGETGETWTQRMVLDVGEKEFFKVRFVLPPKMETWADRDKEWVGGLPQMRGVDIAALLRDDVISVKWGVYVHPVTKHETDVELSPTQIILFGDIRIKGSELKAFATSEKFTQETEQQSAANVSDIRLRNMVILLDDSPEQQPAANVSDIRGITKKEVMGAFDGLKWDYDHWGKNLASPPAWLKDCRVSKGSRSTRISALWNPVQIAVALLDKQISIKRLDAIFVGMKDWTDEWQKASDYFRT